MPALEEITAVFIRENRRFENAGGDVIVGDIQLVNGSREKPRNPNRELMGFQFDEDPTLEVKGKADFSELQPHQTYSFRGNWKPYTNPRTGITVEQFNFVDFYHKQPHSRAGVITYLQHAGKGNGIGSAYAGKLWDAFGSDAVRVLRETPVEAVRAVPRLTIEQAESAAEWLRERQALEDVKIELSTLLDGRGIPKRTVASIVKDHGNRSVAWLTRDPHAIMDYSGCGWKKADALYLSLGRPAAKLRRQSLLAWYTVASDSDGHTWYPANFAVQGIRRNVGKDKARPIPALKLAKKIGQMDLDRNGALSVERTGDSGEIVGQGGSVWLAESRKAWCEERLAESVVNALDETGKRAYTIYDTSTWTEEETPTFARCKRCNRKLTSRSVYIHEGEPFGPDCIHKITKNPAPAIFLADWLATHPVVVEHSQTLPVGVKEYSLERLWPDIDSLRKIDPRITDHQLGEIKKATSGGPISVLGGCAGTGKTFCSAILVKAMCDALGADQIIAGSFTGKATGRLNEMFQEYSIPLRAKTWHSNLGQADGPGSGSWRFARNEMNPFDKKLIISDEDSMRDTNLMYATFAARPAGCHVLLIGDCGNPFTGAIGQLAPVGSGKPLYDLIAAGLPFGELTKIVRSTGGIVEACQAIRERRPWGEGDNLKIHECSTPEQQLETVVAMARKAKADGFDPIWDFQTLVAVNEKSPLSRTAVNLLLQEELNPSPRIRGCAFRLRDKIVNLTNGWFRLTKDHVEWLNANCQRFHADCGGIEWLMPDDSMLFTTKEFDVRIANGDLAEVVEVEPKMIIAKIAKPFQVFRIPRGAISRPNDSGDEADTKSSGTGCSFQLAYGMTPHKMQGSESPVIAVLGDEYPGAKRLCDGSWVYTGFSRAKKDLHVIGRKATFDAFCRKVAIGKRKTLLRELILKKQAERILVDL